MSIDRYVVNGDGLQVDSHGFLVRFYDYEQLQAEVERLTRERNEARAQADGLREALQAMTKAATAMREGIRLLGVKREPEIYDAVLEYQAALRTARAALAALPKEARA